MQQRALELEFCSGELHATHNFSAATAALAPIDQASELNEHIANLKELLP
jgi:hypothetical protein